MKNFNLFKTVIIAGAIFVVACEPEEYNIYLPDGSDTTIVYYIADTTTINEFNVRTFNLYIEGNCNMVNLYVDQDSNGFYTDGVDWVIEEASVCPETPLPVVTTLVTPYGDCKIREILFNGIISYRDTLCPEILPGDTVVIHDTVPGEDIHHASFHYDFNIGSTSDYEPEFENFNSSESSGANRYYFSSYGDTTLAWTKYPVYLNENSNTDTISVKWNSSCKYYVELIEESVSGEQRILYGKIVGGNPSFLFSDDRKYENFNYNFPQGNYSGRRLVVEVHRIPGIDYGFSQNQQFNITEIYIGYSWKE
jgi:hypothetical protein